MPSQSDIEPGEFQEWFHVVLVEPGDNLNIGSVARGMDNLGFSHLHLVAPPRYDPAKAAVSACWAESLLDNARHHQTLEEALAPMRHVVGFTARHGKHRPQHLLLHEWTALLAEEPRGETALLFGPEDHGLTQAHLSHCQWLVRIPSTGANPSFNLAQSVLLALFELSRTAWSASAQPGRDLPPVRDQAQLERLVDEVLTRCGFYYDGTPRPIPDSVKHLLRRIVPDRRELKVLMGIFGKINRALQGRVPIQPYPREAHGEDANRNTQEEQDA